MGFRRLATAFARWLALLFFATSALYGALISSAFAYHQFIRPNLLTPLVWAVTFYDALFLGVFSVSMLSLVPDLSKRHTRVIASAYIVVGGAAALALFVWPLATWLVPGRWALGRASLLLVPLVWLAVIDVSSNWQLAFAVPRPSSAPTRILTTGAVTSIVVWSSYAAVAFTRITGGESAREWLSGMLASLLLHVSTFTALAWLFVGLASAARRVRVHARIEFLLAATVFGVWMFLVLHRLLMPAIALYTAAATLFAVVFSGAVTVAWSGLALRLAAFRFRNESGLAMFLLPISIAISDAGGSRRWTHAAWPLAVVPLLAYGGVASASRMDWGFLLQKTGVLFVWLFTWTAAFRLTRGIGSTQGAERVPYPVVIGSVLLLMALPAGAGHEGIAVSASALGREAYASVDASFKTLDDTLVSRPGADADFYALLIANTNVDRKTSIQPVDIEFSSGPRDWRRAAAPPHIFLFVVDSLRPDYLSPYNTAVSFTPRVEAFGRESLVFRNAFTRYGGTGLAVPSIWSGSLLPHRQYVTPFAPMNALAKLVNRDDYRAVVSLDSIMSQFDLSAANWTDVNPLVRGNRGDLCETTRRMQQHIERSKSDTRPIFAYALPQNVHLSYTQHEPPPTERYEGFDAPTAAQVRVVDTCFGAFIDFLGVQGLYDNSVIVLTADHGDSLGEGGRWGHGYTGFPEIFRVPLIVHLPSAFENAWHADLDAVAFSTDITPTLYALLGHELEPPHGAMFGVPLVRTNAMPVHDRRRDSFLVASSYGAVYGMLSDNGRRLYMLDTINARDYIWDLSNGIGGRPLPVTEAERALRRRMIGEQVAEIAAFFRFQAQL